MKKQLNQKESAELLKALADETRLKIIDSLSQSNKYVGELMVELGFSQPRVSHHLKILKIAGIVQPARDAHRIYYSLTPEIRKKFSGTKIPTLDLGCCEIRFKKRG